MSRYNPFRIVSGISSLISLIIILFCPIISFGSWGSYNFFYLIGENCADMATVIIGTSAVISFFAAVGAIFGTEKGSKIVSIILNIMGLISILILVIWLTLNNDSDWIGIAIYLYIIFIIISIIMLGISDIIINQTRLIAMNNRLNNLCYHDPLTGVLNRRGFFQEYSKLAEQVSGDDNWLYVFSIDLNRLKYINDTFGHNEGDYAIKTIARFAETCAGSRGICARFGGDEFIVAMIDKESGETSSSFIDYFTEMMKDFNGRHHKEYEVMASVGVCSAKLNDDISFDDLMLRADKEMYIQKEDSKGRNFRKSRRD